MYRLILISAVLVSIVSCKKLSGENDYQLTDNCKVFKNEIEQNIIKVNIEKGIHYVSVDTTTCTLKVRYEAGKTDVSWLYAQLDSLGYLTSAGDSSVIAIDSTSNGSNMAPTKEVQEVSSQTDTL